MSSLLERHTPERIRTPSNAPLLVVGLLTLVVFGALVVADVNGSSVGWLRNGSPDSSLIAGQPRAWRGDEWSINTPSSVGNDRAGLPSQRQLGLTETDVATAVLAGPSRDWTTVFRPQDWGYVFFPADRGLSWHWWSSFALSIVGLIGLFRAMRVRTAVAVGLTLMATFSPYTAVFSSPSTALFLGFGGLGVSGVLASLRARSLARILWALLAAWAAVALVVIIYPPWTVSVGLVAAALIVGLTIDYRFPWRHVLVTYGTVLAVTATALVAFLLTHRAAIAASAQTIYPGERRSVSGGGRLDVFLGAPLNPWILEAPLLVPEVSSAWLPAGVTAVAVLLLAQQVFTRARGTGDSSPGDDEAAPILRTTALLMLLTSGLLLAWAFAPLPAIVGRVTQLERVQPGRLQLAMGLLVVIMLALVSLRPVRRPVVEGLLWLAGIGATVLATIWARQHFAVLAPVSWAYVAASAACIAGGAVLLVYGRTRWLGCAVLALYCFGMWAVVNPLYQGLGPLADEPVVTTLEQRVAARPDLRVITFEEPPYVGSQQLVSLAISSGASVLSGPTHYPDRQLMQALAPTQEDLWNNYAWYRWVADPAAAQAKLIRLAPDALEIRINPCGPSGALLAPDLVLSDQPLSGFSCLRSQGTVPWNGAGRTIYLYAVSR
ncbi:hypothetical protein [Lapillicoccus sp.]|uniref:DUF7657 domain-containing protein n=1 Tax=Lapillicoccus sp. TaxID=1909287 RepID=UPI0032666B6D